jgi:predicted nucleic acid-binding protein
MRMYLDAVVTIYLVERVPPFFPLVDAKVSATGVDLVVSDLTRMECLVKPIQKADQTIIRLFHSFFGSVEVLSLPAATFDRATSIRAQFKFKTADALHLAAAVESGCDVFLTNDHQFRRFTGITVDLI